MEIKSVIPFFFEDLNAETAETAKACAEEKEEEFASLRFLCVIFSSVLLCGFCIFGFTGGVTAQNRMQPAVYNFTGFPSDEKNITAELLKNTPSEFQNHPEFGVLPYRAACANCVELLQNRDFYSRYFIAPDNSGHFYVQKSYFPLHYIDKSGQYRTVDPRLRPLTEQPGVFGAVSQLTPTYYDKNNHTTSIEVGDFAFLFNGNMSMYFIDSAGKANQGKVSAEFNQTTVGEGGVQTRNAWDKIDMQQVFDVGKIKTTYVIKQRPDIPAGSRWLVFEDKVTLPESYEVRKVKGATNDGYWMGGLLVMNKNNVDVIEYKRPLYYDLRGRGIAGFYNVEKNGNTYRIMTLVPVEWLVSPHIRYPVYIDPIVLSGTNAIGNYIDRRNLIFSGADMAFSRFPQTCDYTLNVTVPGKTELFAAIIQAEYVVSDSICSARYDSITHDSDFCYFTDVRQYVTGPCGTIGLSCDTSYIDTTYLGTCTTDPMKVGGAGGHRDTMYLINCIPPQCPDYHLDFTLGNQTLPPPGQPLACPDSCSYNCAIGSFFAMTVEGRTIELAATIDRDSVCAKEPVRLTSYPRYGVPPYTYEWTPSGETDSISTVYPDTVAPVPVTITYYDTAYDLCNFYFGVDSVIVVVKPTPPADAGEDTSICDGDPPINIGSSIMPAAATIEWSAEPPSAMSYLSGANYPTPLISVPQGTTGTFEFIVRVEDAQCFQYDTVIVNVAPAPSPVIIADTMRVCEGDAITLSTSQPYAQYHWSTQETTASIGVTESGTYYVTVTDAFGCSASASSPVVTVIPSLAFTIFPDTSLELGNSITLGADIDLNGSSVDSFFWFPDVFISCANCESPVVTPAENQRYYLTVVSSDSCISTDSLSIRIILPDAYAIPNAFSPNNDGKNDKFYILKASGVTVKEFKVFNRWGQLLHDAPTPWNGYYKDAPQDIGAYTYLFILQLFDGREVKEPGTVTLVR